MMRTTWCVTFLGLMGVCGCSSDPGTTSAAAGSGGTATGAAGASAGGGASAGAPAAGAPSGGASAGTGGSAAGSGAIGGGGASAGGAPAGGAGGAAGHAGTGGAAGGTGGGGGSSGSGGGSADCAGHAVSLSGNAASDSAAARVEIDLMGDLPIGNSQRTVEFWAYTKTSDWQANINPLFFYGAAAPRTMPPGFGLDFGSTSGGIGSIDPFLNSDTLDNDGQPSGVMVSMNQWVHFAMTWDGAAVQAFVNGVQKSSKSSSSQTTISTVKSVFTLGGYPAEKQYFPDYLDELRIWNVARSAADILANKNKGLVGNEAGLVGYWKFNESSGTTAMDSVTTAGHTAHNGTLMAAMPSQVPTFVVPTPPSPVTCP